MIFIDTGAFVARHVARDQHHREAKRLWQKLTVDGPPCWTSNHVVDETFTLLGRIAGNRFAIARAASIYDSKRLTILRPEEDVERKALLLFRKFADQAVSFTDCISFALMKQHRIRQAFTFDRHFELAGFERFT
jgi:predicted nucleic acid-binding protein